MKFLLIAVLILTSGSAFADQRQVELAEYSQCAEWTSVNGESTSKQFRLIVGGEEGLVLTASFFAGSSSCQGNAEEVREYIISNLIEDTGTGRAYRLLTGKDEVAGLYFKMMISKDFALIYHGYSLPVEINVMRMLNLKRVN